MSTTMQIIIACAVVFLGTVALFKFVINKPKK